ncbi:MAG: ABC transporter permease [Paracoccaceae bacterium]
MLRLEVRANTSALWTVVTPVIAVIATMIAGGVLFAALGKDPLQAIRIIFQEPLLHPYTRAQLLVKGGPLILIAIGLALGFRAGIWNIGAEGQFIMGAICGGAAGLAVYPAEGVWVLPMMAIAGALGGFLWAMIPALLKIRFGTNEILVSLMLVYVATDFLGGMVSGPLRNPEGFNFPESRSFQDYPSATNPELFAGTGVHYGVLLMFAVVIIAYVIMKRHILGFQIKLTGQSLRAARFGGVNPNVLIAVCLGISGALAGLAGLFEVTGPAGKLTTNFPVGYGFTAIIVAFLGRLHPVGILLAGLVMALTYIGGENAQYQLGVPAAAISVFQGMLLFFLLAVDLLSNYRIVRVRKEVV